MIGLDTNVLIRYFVQDDPHQSRIAVNFIERKCTSTEPGYINKIVMCEIVWVLRRAYGYDKNVVVEIIRKILQTRELLVEDSESIWQAVDAYSVGDADFADYLISITNSKNGCKSTGTFDKQAAKHTLFNILK